MDEFVEPHVRRLVAEHLGVGIEQLVSHVSLREDLAADSLDLVELAVALEAEFAIMVPEHILDEVRTYSDLVHATCLLIRTCREAEVRGAERPPHICVRIVSATGESESTLERTGWLTPYTAETIAEDLVRAGNGARLEVTVDAGTPAGVARVQQQFARLRKRGVRVTVRCDDSAPAAVSGARPPLTDRLLDQLIGAPTVAGHVGDDPWRADDPIGSAEAAYEVDRARLLREESTGIAVDDPR